MSSMPRRAAIVVLLLCAGAGLSPVAGQTPQLTLQSVEVFSSQEGVPLELRVTSAAPIEAIEIGFAVSDPLVQLSDVALEGGVLAGLSLEFSAVSIDGNGLEASILWILDSTAPYSPVVPAGTDQLLATVLVDIDEDFESTSSVLVDFVDGAGTPPATNQVESGGTVIVPATTGAVVSGITNNYMAVQTTPTFAGAVDHLVEIVAMPVANVQGFSTVLTFDPQVLTCSSVGIDQTITEAVGAEFVEEIIENTQGYAILGVLLDIIPPYDNQVIPATGLALPIARYRFDVTDTLMGSDVRTPLRFVDFLGTPPIENIFVIGNNSIRPDSVDTLLDVQGMSVFLRGDANWTGHLDLADVLLNVLYVTNSLGTCPTCPPITCESALDANDDGDLDIADGVYVGNYLYIGGPPPPPPFPTEGPDPTPDSLSCN